MAIIYSYKGLLLAVVLCYFLSSCTTPSTANQPQIVEYTTTWDTSLPNPTQYLLFGSGKKTAIPSDSLSHSEQTQLRDGDILLRKGYGNISDYIADFLQEEYAVTHCAFVLNSQSNHPKVLHTVSSNKHNGMLIEPLAAYIKQSQQNSLIAIRLKASESEIEQVLKQAQQLVQQKIPFDMKFDDQNDQHLYCIEMMRNVFLAVFQEDWLPNRTNKNTIDVLSMNNFFDTTHFNPIFNHFDSANAVLK